MKYEGFKINKIEPNETSEKKESFKTLERQLNRIAKVIAFSAMIWFGAHKGSAQNIVNSEPPHIGPLTEAQARTIEATKEQQAWLLNYISSPKYKDRLTNEYLRWKESDFVFSYEEIANDDTFVKIIYNEEGDTIAQLNLFNKSAVFNVNPTEIPISSETFSIDNVFLPIDIGKYSTEELEKTENFIDEEIMLRKKAVSREDWQIRDSLPEKDSGIHGYYSHKLFSDEPDAGRVYIRTFIEDDTTTTLDESSDTTPVHEFIHQSTDGDSEIIPITEYIFNREAHSGSSYLDYPTEIMARMGVLRYLMEKEGLYRAGEEDFTQEDYEEMLKNEKIMRQFNIQQLLETLDKDSLIWLLNNIADVSPTRSPNSLVNPSAEPPIST